MKQNRKGFTLAELLIVVAIIGVLVAIAIPIFTAQLERSRESTDLANVRSMYAEIMTSAIGEEETFRQGDGTYKGVHQPLKQKEDGWTTDVTNMAIGGVPSEQWVGTPKANGSCTITYDPDTDTVTISWDGSGGGGGSGDDPGDTPGSTPEEAHTNNTQLAGKIGNAVLNMISSIQHNGAHVYVTISNGGTISVSFGGHSMTGIDESSILDMLKGEGLVSVDGTVNFDSADNVTSYTIHVNPNSGKWSIE